MELLYCFTNATLTQRVLYYLLKQLRSHVNYATVIFLNDRWIVRLKLKAGLDETLRENCLAFLDENGLPCQPPPTVMSALEDLDAGDDIVGIMNRHHVSIVSHGLPSPADVSCFQKQFVAGLGYCPKSLV